MKNKNEVVWCFPSMLPMQMQLRTPRHRSNGDFGPIDAQVQVEELADGFIREYRINGRKSLEDADTRWNSHLKPFFGVLRAVDVTSELIGTWTLGSDRGPQMRQ